MNNKIKIGSKVICNNPRIGNDPVKVDDIVIDSFNMFIPGTEDNFTHVLIHKDGFLFVEKKEDVSLVQEYNDYISEFINLEFGFESVDTHTHVKPVCKECNGSGILDFGFYTRKCMKCGD